MGGGYNHFKRDMAHSNERELQLLRKLFLALASEEAPLLTRPVNDLFLQIDCEEGELRIYDDQDELIAHQEIFSWSDTGTIDEPATEAVETVRELVTRLEQKGFWSKEVFARPFSIELVRSDFSVIEELLFLDEDLVKLSSPLLDGLGKELDKFLGELLEDLK